MTKELSALPTLTNLTKGQKKEGNNISCFPLISYLHNKQLFCCCFFNLFSCCFRSCSFFCCSSLIASGCWCLNVKNCFIIGVSPLSLTAIINRCKLCHLPTNKQVWRYLCKDNKFNAEWRWRRNKRIKL